MVDKLKFYLEASERVATNLNPEKAIPNLFKYIQGIMPLDAMAYIIHDPDLDVVRILSIDTDTFSLQPNQEISLLKQARRFFQVPFKRNIMRLNRLPDTPLNHQVVNYLNKNVGKDLGSAILLRLYHDAQTVGFMFFCAIEKDRYTQKHTALIETIAHILNLVTRNGILYYEQLRQINDLKEEKRYLYQQIRKVTGDKLIGENTGLKEIMMSVKKLSRVDTPVLIMGETGVGKELIANALQQSSERSNAPYVKVNCGAIADSLVDSELFGYEKGAFTGANKDQKGRFERAHTGIVFLDEVGELPLAAQVRLLRVVQNKEIERVGGKATIPVDIRIIAATHRDLLAMVKAGTFREDLYFRLNVFPITIPPLRHRIEDIPALLDHFIKKTAQRMKLKAIPGLKRGTLAPFLRYAWPGNIRELENLVERAMIINPEGPLDFKNLMSVSVALPLPENDNFESLDKIMRRYIIRALDHTKGRISGKFGAAEILNIHPNTLRSRMNKLGINYLQNKSITKQPKGSADLCQTG